MKRLLLALLLLTPAAAPAAEDCPRPDGGEWSDASLRPLVQGFLDRSSPNEAWACLQRMEKPDAALCERVVREYAAIRENPESNKAQVPDNCLAAANAEGRARLLAAAGEINNDAEPLVRYLAIKPSDATRQALRKVRPQTIPMRYAATLEEATSGWDTKKKESWGWSGTRESWSPVLAFPDARGKGWLELESAPSGVQSAVSTIRRGFWWKGLLVLEVDDDGNGTTSRSTALVGHHWVTRMTGESSLALLLDLPTLDDSAQLNPFPSGRGGDGWSRCIDRLVVSPRGNFLVVEQSKRDAERRADGLVSEGCTKVPNAPALRIPRAWFDLIGADAPESP